MVFRRIGDWFAGEPKLPVGEPTRLPSYFPVEPKGCESHAQKLFACLANEATQKARDMEKAGLHKSYFPDVVVKPGDEKAAELVAQRQQQKLKDGSSSTSDRVSAADEVGDVDSTLPQPGENPLDQCRSEIAYYKRCCDRELKKRQNWILTEPYRVQEEYRYKKAGADAVGSKK